MVFNTRFLKVVLLVSCCIHFPQCDAADEFCTALGGTQVGDQCFFSPRSAVNTWTKAWDICARNGAKLAQIHTSAEYEAIKSMLTFSGGGPTSLWIALQTKTDGTPPSTDCAVPNGTTYWYDSSTAQNDRLVAANTWIRYHGCENRDADSGNEVYIMLTYYDGVFTIQDVGARGQGSWENYPLCQASGCGRLYTKSADNMCIIETPIETSQANSVQQCADLCTKKEPWCHSFNLVCNECQLFSFSSREECPDCPRTGTVKNCGHYEMN